MLTLLKNSSQKPTHSIHRSRHQNPDQFNRSLNNKYICPCCSYLLLRHINANGIYWYCSHCHQKMPPSNITEVLIGVEDKISSFEA